jgi:hypothetical protein
LKWRLSNPDRIGEWDRNNPDAVRAIKAKYYTAHRAEVIARAKKYGSRPGMGTYSAMMTRCHNAKHKSYRGYGSRGITVCDRWRGNPSVFLADMGEPPKGYSIDRIDVNGNYEPSNCRWATRVMQEANKRGK